MDAATIASRDESVLASAVKVGIVLGRYTISAPEAGKYGLWQVSVEAPPNTWREQETGEVLFSSVAAHDAHTLTATQVPTCARGEHTQQHVTLVLCGSDVVGNLWTGKALRELRIGLDDIRRKTAHRVPEEPTSDRHPSARARSSAPSAVVCVETENFGDLVFRNGCPATPVLPPW